MRENDPRTRRKRADADTRDDPDNPAHAAIPGAVRHARGCFPGREDGAHTSLHGDPEENEEDDHDAQAADELGAEPSIRGPGGGSLGAFSATRDTGADEGHHVMDRAALDAALDAAGYDGAFDHLSGGEEQRVRLLLHYRDRMPLFRPHVVASPAMIARLRALDIASPNFAAVSRLARRAAHLSFVSRRPLRVPPVLMLGAPGVGKTRYARALTAALGTSLEVITGSTIPDTGSLTGYPPVWRGAGPGRIAKALVAARTSGPLLLIDECEKITDRVDGSSACPLDRLLTLLEPHSAASFEDEHLRVPMRAQHMQWLFAANSLDGISEPVRDRVVIVTIPGLGADQHDDVLEAMLAEVAREAGVPVALSSRDALKPLRGMGLRRARLAFEIAIPRAIERERRFLTLEDLDCAAKLLGAAEQRQPIGFVRHRGSGAD